MIGANKNTVYIPCTADRSLHSKEWFIFVMMQRNASKGFFAADSHVWQSSIHVGREVVHSLPSYVDGSFPNLSKGHKIHLDAFLRWPAWEFTSGGFVTKLTTVCVPFCIWNSRANYDFWFKKEFLGDFNIWRTAWTCATWTDGDCESTWCNAIPKTVPLFSTADPVGPEFEDLLIDGYDLSLTLDATVYSGKSMNLCNFF
jgi:hypothetical protein